MKKTTKVITPQGNFRKLILHFNIDKTIVMRDSLGYNNSDFLIREILSELIWGKPDVNKKGEEYFKLESKQLDFERPQTDDPEIVNFNQYLHTKYAPLTQEEYDKIDPKPEKTLEEINKERYSTIIKELCEIVEPNHAGVKFKRNFEDMRKKLRVDEKIQLDLGLKLDNSKLDEQQLDTLKQEMAQETKFHQLGEEYDKKDKFRKIFRNSYHRIIISFFSLMQNLKKIKQDFAVVFRFFGHDEAEIEEFIYEFNCFSDCLHPRYCGDYGFGKFKFDVEKDKKDFKINSKTQDYMAVSYRSEQENQEKFFFETKDHPPFAEIEEQRNNIDEFYTDSQTGGGGITPSVGYKEIYLNFMNKVTENCSFCILDDYSYYTHHNNSHGKLLLIDPYDTETLQIFFDTDLHKNPDKVDIIDVVTGKRLDFSYTINKFLVNVEPYKAIVDSNYFNHKIEECINNRKSEILKMQGKELPIIPVDENLNVEEEMKRLPGDIYLQMTVLPLLQNAMNMCEILRPQDPISFIANFMLVNKNTTKNIEQIAKELPKIQEFKVTENLTMRENEEQDEEEFKDEQEQEQPPQQ